jgi:hypothetical protein
LTSRANSGADEWVEVLKRKAPAYLDLFTAETDAQFEGAFDALLEKAVTHLETNKTHFATLDEEGLSAVLAGSLAVPGLTVTQETHSNGHVDLTIQADHGGPARKKLGEAKIYDGPAHHFGGLDQLLGRYTTGREGRGLLIEYYRKSNISGLVRKLRDEMDKDRPCNQQGQTGDHTLKWSFLSVHSHSSGEAVNVGHVGCNLWIDKAP